MSVGQLYGSNPKTWIEINNYNSVSLSLIAYNFVIDKDLPKLEYLTVMDYIILISYIYATIPTFLSIITNNFINTKNTKILAFNSITKRYGLISYLFLIIFILILVAQLYLNILHLL